MERRRAGQALDVVGRTIRYALKGKRNCEAVRCLDATCLPWLGRVADVALQEGEVSAVSGLRQLIRTWSEQSGFESRMGTLRRMADRLAEVDELVQLAKPSLDLQPLAQLLPASAAAEAATNKAQALEAQAAQAREEQRNAQSSASAPSRESGGGPAASAERGKQSVQGRGTRRRGGRAAAEGVARGSEGAKESSREAETRPQEEKSRQQQSASRERRKPHKRSRRDERQERKGREAGKRTGPGAGEKGKASKAREARKAARRLSLRHAEGAGQAVTACLEPPPSLRAVLEREGVVSVADLLMLRPKRYELLPRAVTPSEPMLEGQKQVVRATVKHRYTRLSPLGRRFEVVLTDGQAEVTCRWLTPLDAAYRARFQPGKRVSVFGNIERNGDETLLHEGDLVWVDSRGQGRQACYDLPGVADSELRSLLRRAQELFAGNLLDPVPAEQLRRLRLLELGEALRRLHFPSHGYKRGVERLAFDELLLYQLGTGIGRRRRPKLRGTAHSVSHRLVSQILTTLGRELSDSQEEAFSAIRRDLAAARPMNRLLQGEVGLGKGFVALLAAVVVAESREQVVFLAPDGLAAEHRYLFAAPLLKSVGLVPALVLDKPDSAQLDALRRGEIHVLFASHALGRSWPAFRRLGMAVVEEREEYGTFRLQDLPSQGVRPDLLVLTDAPIPTSIALTVFGSMDLSLLPGQLGLDLKVEAFLAEDRASAYAMARAELESGRQAYVVLPMVRGQEPLNQRDLARFAEALRSDPFPGRRIGLFSALMTREERQRVYEDFLHRRLDVLLTTTIIEDGPPVATATAMVVEQADRFDLIRMHRLRAHVARGIRPGRCMFVLGERPDPMGAKRVSLICQERDAFQIAEADLVTRGPEALLGERANELPSFRFVEPLEHRELLVKARAAAFGLLEESPDLDKPEHKPLRDALQESWRQWFPGKPVWRAGRTPERKHRSGRRRRRRRR